MQAYKMYVVNDSRQKETKSITRQHSVSCPDTYRTLFYDEATWPTGCELRDWYFKDSVRRQPDM